MIKTGAQKEAETCCRRNGKRHKIIIFHERLIYGMVVEDGEGEGVWCVLIDFLLFYFLFATFQLTPLVARPTSVSYYSLA